MVCMALSVWDEWEGEGEGKEGMRVKEEFGTVQMIGLSMRVMN